MLLGSVSLVIIASRALALALQQLPLKTGNDLIDKLTEAEIIPGIIDRFEPLVEVSAFWKNDGASLGNSIDPSELQHRPDVLLSQWLDNETLLKHKSVQITLALTDPDAPSHDNNTWSQVCHWLVTRIPYHGLEESKKHNHFKDIIEYKPPGPPAKTGAHRYVFVVLAPLNGTTRKLALRTPDDRRRWGYDNAGAGVRDYALEHGLGVIGANFIYSQNKEQ